MPADVVCLRPEEDFTRASVAPPASLAIAYRKPEDSDTQALIATARALVIPAVGAKLPAAWFEQAYVKLVQVTGAGVDRLDEPAMKRLGVAVANVPGGSNEAVAEYALTSAAALLRRIPRASVEIRAGRYAAFRGNLIAENVPGLSGLQVGIVGMGTIGHAVARAFHRAGSRIAYCDPAPRDARELATLDACPMPLEQLMATSDIVTLHVPLVTGTRGLIGAHELALMKRDAVLINAARGGVVDEAALAGHLATGRLAGAAIDVYSVEPPPPDNPLLTLPARASANVLLTPHIAGVTRQSSAFLFRAAWENVSRVLENGLEPLNRVY